MAKKPTGTKRKAVKGKGAVTAKNRAKGAGAGAARITAAQAANRSAQRTRKAGLQFAARAQGQAQQAQKKYRMAAIRAFAAKRTFQIAAQGSIGSQQGQLLRSLQSRAAQAAQLATQARFAAIGVRLFAHRALMGTQTTAQAKASNRKFLAQIRTKQAKAYFAKLAKQIAKAQAQVKHLQHLKATGHKLSRGQRNALAANQKFLSKHRAAQQRKAQSNQRKPAKGAKARGAQGFVQHSTGWLGGLNDQYKSCVATAIANRLNQIGHALYDEDVLMIMAIIGENCSLYDGLSRFCDVFEGFYFNPQPSHHSCSGTIIGFDADTDEGPRPHAALRVMNNMMVSWGEETLAPPADTIEEVWYLGWEGKHGPRLTG